MARQEIEEAMSNFCHPENPGSSHWLGCACSESAWAEKLAAAEERARGMGEALREIGKHECRHAKLGDGIDCTRVGMVFPDGFTACPSCIARAALAPPPEAAPAYRQMTPEEDAAQRRSFAYGNAKLANDDVTREMLAPPPEAEKRGEG